MNLIKQLGGYEQAKATLCEAYSRHVTRISYKTTLVLDGVSQNIITGVYIDDLEAALLEHRRQHNIFEVGDYVFHTVCNNPLLEKITWIDGVRIITNLAGRPTLIETFRHATDAEINAGKRLGVGNEKQG